MIIRQAEPADALAIATIHVRSWQHTYRDFLPGEQLDALSIAERERQWQRQLDRRSPMHTLVAERDGAVVGFASWGPAYGPGSDGTTAMLYSIYLSPQEMGKGFGSALMLETEANMVKAGIRAGRLHVLRDNIETRTFYERHGWKIQPESEQTETFFGIDVVTIDYRKGLA